MSDRLIKCGLLVAGAAVLAIQVWAKPRPDAEEVHEFARTFTDAKAWEDRIAPDFELTRLDGARVRLADVVGTQVVILNFFATWCGPCRAEMPELERYQRSQGDSVLLLGIDAEEKHTVVEAFVAEMKITFPVAIDGDSSVMRLYDVNSFPTTIVIGVDGKVKLYETGAIANADVALGAIVAPQVTALREGRGIARDAYLAEAAAARAADATQAGAAPPLEGRARSIAEAMPCPCGCTDKVAACRCSTATAIKKRLGEGGYDGKTDAEVMEGLNREFCMKGM
jgi:thiol-disulfide isomerase/thioredoxin